MDIKYIFTEIGNPDFTSFFDTDCYTEKAGGIEYTLFLIHEGNRHSYGLNYDEYKNIVKQLEILFNDFEYVEEHEDYSYKKAMEENGLVYNPTNCQKLKELYRDNTDPDNINTVKAYLSIITGKKWKTAYKAGYCQSDYVTALYCEDIYKDVTVEMEMFLAMGKEFSLTELEEGKPEEECWTVYGYYLSDSQCWQEDIKKILCENEGINPDETIVRLISNTYTRTEYEYTEL